jgi:predicted AAA+ superfamily ATPase
MTLSHDLLRLKLAESLAAPLPDLTRRDVRLPGIRGKAVAVIGVRRGGKTSFLRQRMVNPRKAYPIDTGLIALFERSARTHHGRALETAVMLELERRGYEVAYVRTTEGWETDFIAHHASERPLLVQVCLESEGTRRGHANAGDWRPPHGSTRRREPSS